MDQEEMKILIFELNGEHYATDILDVERILGYVQTTEMPDAPSFVEGVINYEDSILPIISLNKKFKFNSTCNKEQAKIIVVKREEKKYGVVVDNVYEVTDINKESFETAPTITNQVSQKYIRGLVKLKDKIVILLNMGNILNEEEENMIF